MIPASLIYWEVTGDDRMMRELAEGRPLAAAVAGSRLLRL